METASVKGVRFRLEGLAPESRAYLEAKLRRCRRREQRAWNPLFQLVRAILPRDYRLLPLESLVAGRILVVGCAGGIEAMGLGAVGIDIDRDALRIAADLRAHAPEIRADFLAASAGDLPFRDAAFDSLLSDNVVEHIPEGVLGRHFREAARVLRPGGQYVFTTPNRLFEQPAREGHVSLHCYGEWEALARRSGFRAILTPRRRSGALESLEWKRDLEERAARKRKRLGLSHQGVRTVAIVAMR